MVRKLTKRTALYNVAADKPFVQISYAVRTFAERQGVHISFTKLLKKVKINLDLHIPFE